MMQLQFVSFVIITHIISVGSAYGGSGSYGEEWSTSLFASNSCARNAVATVTAHSTCVVLAIVVPRAVCLICTRVSKQMWII